MKTAFPDGALVGAEEDEDSGLVGLEGEVPGEEDPREGAGEEPRDEHHDGEILRRRGGLHDASGGEEDTEEKHGDIDEEQEPAVEGNAGAFFAG